MAVKHLSEKEIQNYLDGNLSPKEKTDFQNHLASCTRCHEMVDAYKEMYAGLKQEPDFHLSPRFTQLVMNRIEAQGSSFFAVRLKDILLSILGLIVGLGTTLYFIDLSQFMKPFEKMFSGTEEKMVTSVRESVGGLNLDFQLILAAIVILAAIAGLDRFISRYKDKLAAYLKMMPMSCFL